MSSDDSEHRYSTPRQGGAGPPRSRPLPKGDSFFTPGAGQLRRAIERRSAVPLVWLHNAPRWLLPATMALAFVGGLLLSGVAGAVLLVVLAAFFGWLAYLAWPNLRRGERTMRVLVVFTLFVLGLLQSGIF